MKKSFAFSALLSIAMVSSAYAADTGLYIAADIGVANTQVDPSNSQHATYITSSTENKFGYGFTGGYQFNKYIGVQLSYVDFGKASFNLTRGTTGEQSVATIQNSSWVPAIVGFLPISEKFILSGKIGSAITHTKVDRVGAPSYSVSDDQTSFTYGIGGLYAINENISLRVNADFYPKITKTNENATDTDGYTVTAGVQYKF